MPSSQPVLVSQMAGLTEVKAQIRLKFTDRTGKKVQCNRQFQVRGVDRCFCAATALTLSLLRRGRFHCAQLVVRPKSLKFQALDVTLVRKHPVRVLVVGVCRCVQRANRCVHTPTTLRSRRSQSPSTNDALTWTHSCPICLECPRLALLCLCYVLPTLTRCDFDMQAILTNVIFCHQEDSSWPIQASVESLRCGCCAAHHRWRCVVHRKGLL